MSIQIPPVPPLKPASPEELAKRDKNKTLFIKDNIFPDDATMALLLARDVNNVDSQLLETLPSLLPAGPFTADIAEMLCQTIGEIYARVQSSHEAALPDIEVVAYIRKMPCQRAGEAFLHAYKHFFKNVSIHAHGAKNSNAMSDLVTKGPKIGDTSSMIPAMKTSSLAGAAHSAPEAATDSGLRKPTPGASSTANRTVKQPSRKRKASTSQELPAAKRSTATGPTPATSSQDPIESSRAQPEDVRWEDFIDPALLEEITGESVRDPSPGQSHAPSICEEPLFARGHALDDYQTHLQWYPALMGVAPSGPTYQEAMPVPEVLAHPAQYAGLHRHSADPYIFQSSSAEDWIQADMRDLGISQEILDEMREYAAANGGRVLPLPGQEDIQQYAHFDFGPDGYVDPFAPLELREHPDGSDGTDDAISWSWYQS